MKYIIRCTAILVILTVFSSLGTMLYLGSEGLSELLGVDVNNRTFYLGLGAKVEFSFAKRFPMIVAWGILLIALATLGFLFAERLTTFLKRGCSFLKEYSITTYSLIKASNVKYLLLIPTLAAIYSAYKIPVMYDEALTYYDFIKPSFLYGLFFYPYPNNHVFLSLLVNITNELPIDLLFRLRLPSLFASLLTWILVYRFARKYYGENTALFVVALSMVVPITFYYGFLTRGYVFVVLFLVVCLYAAFNIVFDGNKRRNWIFFTLGGILGAYSVPAFLYPFATISVFILIYNYKNIRTQILYSALVGVGTIILYFPVLVVGGIEALAQNGYVLPIPRADVLMALPGYYKGVAVYIFYLPPILIALLLTVAGGYALYKKDKRTVFLWILFIIAPCVLLLLHAVIPFFRIFNYYGFITVFLLGISLAGLLNKLDKRVLLVGLITLQILGLTNFFTNKTAILLDASSSEEIVDLLLENDKTYCFHAGIETEHVEGNMKFEGERRNLDIVTIRKWMLSVDDVDAGYDYYFILKQYDSTKEHTPWKEMIGPFAKPINIYRGEDLR